MYLWTGFFLFGSGSSGLGTNTLITDNWLLITDRLPMIPEGSHSSKKPYRVMRFNKIQRIKFRNMWYNKNVIFFTLVIQNDPGLFNVNRDKLTLAQVT